MAIPGSPDWWLDRLYKRLRDRQPRIKLWDDWYTGRHPVPKGYEDAEALFQRLMETVGLNMLAVVTNAALDRMEITGFEVSGKSNDDVWEIWQDNNFDFGSEQVRQEKMALSESYVMIDPNSGSPIMTPEHPEQCIVETGWEPGVGFVRRAGLKVWLDEAAAEGPTVRAWLDLGVGGIHSYAAPTRVFNNTTSRSSLALKPAWEFQPQQSGPNSLGEVAMVPFVNGGRMLATPVPEFEPAIIPQRRINKTLLDRMAMQDQGAFKAMWATGIKIPRDPATNKPVEGFIKAINRTFVNEDPNGKYGQLEAEDIKQMLEAVQSDITDCATVVPTSADQIMGKLVNVSGDGLKLAQNSEVKRVKRHIRHESEPWEDTARLLLKAAGKSVPNDGRMKTTWANCEYRTDTEQANAATVAISAGMPQKVAWAKYFGATPDEVDKWADANREQLNDPITAAMIEELRAGRRTSDGQ